MDTFLTNALIKFRTIFPKCFFISGICRYQFEDFSFHCIHFVHVQCLFPLFPLQFLVPLSSLLKICLTICRAMNSLLIEFSVNRSHSWMTSLSILASITLPSSSLTYRKASGASGVAGWGMLGVLDWPSNASSRF